jgi:NAD-dependent dihydropyrimidine dehydrogenase PreA subunit
MVQIEIHEQACRGCQMCKEICPTEVFSFDEEKGKVRVKEMEDCIACLSCAYICPSGAIKHSDYHGVKNFYRDLDFCRRMGKFL